MEDKFESAALLMPTVALRGLVVFPGMQVHFDVGREKSIDALKAALAGDRKIFLTAQKDIAVDDPDFNDLYKLGVVATVSRVAKLPGEGDIVRVSVKGMYRARLNGIVSSEPHLVGAIRACAIRKYDRENEYGQALIRSAKSIFEGYAQSAPQLSPDVVLAVLGFDHPGDMADFIAGNIALEFSDRQSVLEELDPIKRLEKLCVLLLKESRLLEYEDEIQEMVQKQMDDSQREYYLREQLKVISSQLNNGVSPEEEIQEFRDKIAALPVDDASKEKLLRECDRLERYAVQSPEAAVSRNYLETCLELPWGKYTKDNLDLTRAHKILEADHYGLKKVKERILEFMAVRSLAPDVGGQIICLVGPPGVGKTSVAKSVARAMGRKYARISLGGVHDEAEIRGHRKTYIGSMPGRIIAAIQQAGSSNPLILLDEVDKLGSDYKGDPSSALLEVLDSEQNYAFRDNYLEIPYDLSKVLFITTANVASDIPAPLYDRMEVIELGSYTAEEKFHIAKKHLIPKQLKKHGLTARQLRFTDGAIRNMIDGYTREAGVRRLEQLIASVCRKAAKRIAEGEEKISVKESDLQALLGNPKFKEEKLRDSDEVGVVNGLAWTSVGGEEKISVKESDLQALLGNPKFKEEKLRDSDEVGVVNGLAWTSVGGELLKVEAAVLDGTGKLELTGSLGDVMKESAHAAMSYVRSRADVLGIDSKFYKNKDIHIHCPEGAVPKDGPSAGVTMTTALVSALTGAPVRRDVAMTGEVTLRGRVLPIGGLKEKSMAAYIRGIKTVIIPKANVPDLDEVDDAVKANVEFVPVSHVDEVLSIALLPVSKPAEVVDAHDDSKDSKHADIPAHDKTGGRRSRVTQ